MRYLNKIIFIQSAHINYTEIRLDGNVHFIGDQGVGKSTVLRAVLFFYNADTQKLGISTASNKDQFQEYYFKHTNSHIIYEVVSNEAKFLVWLYKEHGRLCYRFIESPYEQSFFMTEATKGYQSLTPDNVIKRIRSESYCSRKIIYFKEFRDILYGAVQDSKDKKVFKKYALLEYNMYHNIPKTISNIFLNAKLQSSAIKTTIINSLNEGEYQTGEEAYKNESSYNIDLAVLRKFLNDFEHDRNDIETFEKNERKATLIIEHYSTLLRLEQEKIETAQLLGGALQTKRDRKLSVAHDIKTHVEEEEKLVENIEHVKKDFNAKFEVLKKQITILENNIAQANQKKRYYHVQNITAILERVDKEESWQIALQNKQDRKRTLLAQFDSIEQKYQILFNQIENKRRKTENAINNQINQAKGKYFEEQNHIVETYQGFIENLNKREYHYLEENRKKRDTIQDDIRSLEQKRDKIKNTRYFEQELKAIETKLKTLQDGISEKTHQITLCKKEIETLQNNAQHEQTKLQHGYENQRQEIERQRKKSKKQHNDIVIKLQSFENSFYDFLNQHYPDWANTIGKVCHEDILFSDALKPNIETINDLLFGVELDLNHEDVKVQTIAEYQSEQSRLKTELANLDEKSIEIKTEYLRRKKGISQKFNKKIKLQQKGRKTLDYEISQAKRRIQKLEFDHDDYNQQAIDTKNKALAEIHPKIVTKKEQLRIIKQAGIDIRNEYAQKKSDREKAKHQAVSKLKQAFEVRIKGLKQSLHENNEKAESEKKDIEQQKQHELHGKGLDDSLIAMLDKEIAKITKELTEIHALKMNIVAEYKIAKRDFIDHLPEFEEKKEIYENDMDTMTKKHEHEIQQSNEKRVETQHALEVFRKENDEIARQLQNFEHFKNNLLYQELAYYIDMETASNTENITLLIGKLRDFDSDLQRTNHDEFKPAINSFVSKLRPENIFNFHTQFSDNLAYRKFAENLKEFIDEGKINIYKEKFKEMHIDLVEKIIGEIEKIMSKQKVIRDTISKINNGFKNSNFIGVVQAIELKFEESNHGIVQILSEIKRFRDANPYNIGQTTLFTGQHSQENNEKIMSLLMTLLKKIQNTKQIKIQLEDTFTLKFRVVENQTDTGWQQQLTDIGSNGTDILVKAMIYIMLLDVFKEKASRKKVNDFYLHCVMDEIGAIHLKNIESLIRFANERNIWMISGSPNEQDALAYKYVYDFIKDNKSITKIHRLIDNNQR